jgi:hypothetical protein
MSGCEACRARSIILAWCKRHEDVLAVVEDAAGLAIVELRMSGYQVLLHRGKQLYARTPERMLELLGLS